MILYINLIKMEIYFFEDVNGQTGDRHCIIGILIPHLGLDLGELKGHRNGLRKADLDS